MACLNYACKIDTALFFGGTDTILIQVRFQAQYSFRTVTKFKLSFNFYILIIHSRKIIHNLRTATLVLNFKWILNCTSHVKTLLRIRLWLIPLSTLFRSSQLSFSCHMGTGLPWTSHHYANSSMGRNRRFEFPTAKPLNSLRQ
jgi:hypothetical protein